MKNSDDRHSIDKPAVLDRLVGMSPKEPVIEKDVMLMDRLPKQ